MFQSGEIVQILQHNEVVGTGRVIQDSRSEIEIENIDPNPGEKTTFAHIKGVGWKMLFPGLDGERCFSQRAPAYDILKAT